MVKSRSRRVFKSGELKLLAALPPTTLLLAKVNYLLISKKLTPPDPLILHLSRESVHHPVRRHGGLHSTTLKRKNILKKMCWLTKLPYRLCDEDKVFKETPNRHPQVSQLTSSEGGSQGASFSFQQPSHFGPKQTTVNMKHFIEMCWVPARFNFHPERVVGHLCLSLRGKGYGELRLVHLGKKF